MSHRFSSPPRRVHGGTIGPERAKEVERLQEQADKVSLSYNYEMTFLFTVWFISRWN